MKTSGIFICLLLPLVLILLLVDATSVILNNGTLEERILRYEHIRQAFLEHEQQLQLGGKIVLNENEVVANEQIMSAKLAEYDSAFAGAGEFKPAKHFFKVYEKIAETPLFQLLKDMPKGGALHVHDVAICSVDRLIEFTYWEHLWACVNGETYESFRFAREQPIAEPSCQWELLKLLRHDMNSTNSVDRRLRAQLTLYPHEEYNDGYDVWRVFGKIFRLVYGLLTYEPVWAKYFECALTEFYADGVQYLEIRSTLPIIYDLDGTNFTILDTVRVIKNTTEAFQQQNKNFIGVKIIYSPRRHASDEGFNVYLHKALLLKDVFPQFFAGFDLVGHEDAGRPLHDFSHKLISVMNELDFYFHAGETNWYGTSTDENLLDAILLGTKRIGHGYAIVKHPELLKIVKQHNIAIEVSPISNQVLQHVSDLRNHPCSILFAGNYPVVISSDDNAYWRATPLTHDFYVAFLGIASKTANLGMLKQLAKNSLVYSALNDQQKKEAFELWESQWDAWIRRVAGLT